MRLEEINYQNVWKVCNLKVKDYQDDFVASNIESLAEAYLALKNGYVFVPYAIYDEDLLVGFTAISYGRLDEKDQLEISKDNYGIIRLMIDKKYQQQGYGKKAMETIWQFIKTFPFGKGKYCYLSYQKDNQIAKKLYSDFGFRENGQFDGDEVIAVKKIEQEGDN